MLSVPLIPKVTTSRKELIAYIMKVCEVYSLPEKEEEWTQHIKEQMLDGHYFEGMIFIARISPYLIWHELIHHISRILRGLTKSRKWLILDDLVDYLDILIFKKV